MGQRSQALDDLNALCWRAPAVGPGRRGHAKAVGRTMWPHGCARGSLRAERRRQHRLPGLRRGADRPGGRAREPIGAFLGLGISHCSCGMPRGWRPSHASSCSTSAAWVYPIGCARSRPSRPAWTTSALCWRTPTSGGRRSWRPTREPELPLLFAASYPERTLGPRSPRAVRPRPAHPGLPMGAERRGVALVAAARSQPGGG